MDPGGIEGGGIAGVQRHDCLINPGIPIPREASKVSGIGDDEVADEPPFERRADRVRELLSDAVLVAHNLSFDLAFLRSELERAGKTWPHTRAEIDTLPLAQRLLSHLRQHKLGMICKELGVDLGPRGWLGLGHARRIHTTGPPPVAGYVHLLNRPPASGIQGGCTMPGASRCEVAR
ncbi:3'-5' exonuclease [Myxococcota bacterium]|nr:3'-5' exonuclease [Myxococcota bacterium]